VICTALTSDENWGSILINKFVNKNQFIRKYYRKCRSGDRPICRSPMYPLLRCVHYRRRSG